MNKKMMILATLFAASLAQAQVGKPAAKVDPARPRLDNAGIRQDGKPADVAVAKAGGNDTRLQSLQTIQKLFDDAAGKGHKVDSKVANSYMVEIAKIQNADMKKWAGSLVDAVARLGSTAKTEDLAFVAKIMDLASRAEVGVNNAKFMDLLQTLAKNLETAGDLRGAVEKTVDAVRLKEIMDCV